MTRLVHLGELETGKRFNADLDVILRSNVLAQANSGGGKSWLLRRMIEQSHGRVPQIIIDPEGEFSTLREKFDFVLVGKGGDTPADVRSAQLLAHRLLELGASAIVDLFEMSKTQRPLWVATFVQALVDAPKKLWRDLLLYVDEAHELAPEPGHGAPDSNDAKRCRSALIDFAAKGRKRGYGTIAATQRLGKLSKDFAAELKNVLIGQTFIDIDRERAVGCLGIAKGNKEKFFHDAKTLSPGSFYALGRAFVLEPTLVTIGGVETEHPTPGRRQKAAPPPTKKILHLLPQLADLPAEAEQKVLTEKELRARIAELERDAKAVPLFAPAKPKTAIVERDVVSAASLMRIERFAVKLERAEGHFADVITVIDKQRNSLAQAQQAVVSEMGNLRTVITKAGQPPGVPAAGIPRALPRAIKVPPIRRESNVAEKSNIDAYADDDGALPEKSQRMIAALRQGEAMGLSSMPFKNVATIAGVSPSSGTTANRKGALTRGGYAVSIGSDLSLTDKGRAFPITVDMPPTDRVGLLAYWKHEIGTEKISAMLDYVVTHGHATDEDLREAAQMTNSGTFSNYKGALVRRGLMMKSGDEYLPAEAFGR